MQKSVRFENPTNFPGVDKEAVIGKVSDNTGAHLGILCRTDSGIVYVSDESNQTAVFQGPVRLHQSRLSQSRPGLIARADGVGACQWRTA